jgi:hypothetical protein
MKTLVEAAAETEGDALTEGDARYASGRTDNRAKADRHMLHSALFADGGGGMADLVDGALQLLLGDFTLPRTNSPVPQPRKPGQRQ